MGVIFDTSEIMAIERNRQDAETLIAGRENELFGISVISVAELLHGVERADTAARKIKRQAFVEKVIEIFPVFPFDTTTARIYAKLWATVSGKGMSVGAHGLMIAATAIALDYTVVTANMRDFGRIDGLKVEKR